MIQKLDNKIPVYDFRSNICGYSAIRSGELVSGNNTFGFKNVGHVYQGQLDTDKQPNNWLNLVILHGKTPWVNS